MSIHNIMAFDENKNTFKIHTFSVDMTVMENNSGYKVYRASDVDLSFLDTENPYRFLFYENFELDEISNYYMMILNTITNYGSKVLDYWMTGGVYSGLDMVYYGVTLYKTNNTVGLSCYNKDGTFHDITNQEVGTIVSDVKFILSY